MKEKLRLITISTLCYNNSKITRGFLSMLEATLPKKGVEIILVNNGSVDDTQDVIFDSSLSNKIYLPFGENIGFPRGHNEALKYAKGEYFICLNNDIIFKDSDWVSKLIEPLKDPSVAIVGLKGEYCTLRTDGMATKGEVVDYADGGCIAGKTELYRKYGLFSNSLKMFFFEDSDLSLRYRQMGYGIVLVPIRSVHLRSSTLKTIDPEYRKRIIVYNGNIFKKRWGGYLRNKMFTNTILVKMFSHGGGDIICMTPILEALREDHPKARLELETSFPDVFMNNKFVNEIYGVRHSYQKGYDRVIDINPNYSSYKLIVEEAETIAATKVRSKDPKLYMTKMELETGKEIIDSVKESEDDMVFIVNLQMTRSGWSGRCWNLDESIKLVGMLREAGAKVIEVGKNVPSVENANLSLLDKTELRELFAIVANADVFVGIDSMCFHIAQAFKIKSFVIFGATEPISRIVDFSHTYPVRMSELPCIGCYQKKAKSTYNKCVLLTEDCMHKLTAERVFAHISGEIDPAVETLKYLQNYVRDRNESK